MSGGLAVLSKIGSRAMIFLPFLAMIEVFPGEDIFSVFLSIRSVRMPLAIT